jgi:hypothetical protein
MMKLEKKFNLKKDTIKWPEFTWVNSQDSWDKDNLIENKSKQMTNLNF